MTPAEGGGGELRLATLADCPQLAVLAAMAHLHPWSEQQYRDSLSAGHECWLQLDPSGEPVACCVVSSVLDECEILDIAVAPHWRRRGIARDLLRKVMASVPSGGRLLLEVRESNRGARALYLSLGLHEDGRRPGYYRLADGGREDALLMSWQCP